MNKKAFTLIELLGVIMILSIIMLLVFPNIINSVKNSSKKTDDVTLNLIYNASDLYISSHEVDYPKENGNKYIISLSDLVNGEYIKSPIKLSDNDEDVTNLKCVQVTYNNSYKYELKNNGECVVYDSSKTKILKGSEPVLNGEQFVPVIYDGDNWKIADKSSNWYDYENQWWANAVILTKDAANTKKVGDTITVDGTNPDALAMFVWIPRYEYKIEGKYGNGGINVGSPGEIDINFISKDTTTPTEGYRIHPAFTLGDEELSGIWVGKFEPSHTTLTTSLSNHSLNCSDENCTNADNLRILPNVVSLRWNNVSNFFFASRSMSRENNPFGIDKNNIDTHMMKNSEWGAVTYLSQSKYGKYGNSDYIGSNKEVYINNSSNRYTGRSGGNTGGNTAIKDTYTDQTSETGYSPYGFYTYDGYLLNYDTNTKSDIRDMTKGPGASTTGNIYGIYDMSGGAYEYVMGVFANSNGDLWSGTSASSNSGFTGKVGTSAADFTGIPFPDSKYYDIYKASSGTTINENTACNGGICYGHAISETKSWYSDFAYLVSVNYQWQRRGGYYGSSTGAGLFARGTNYGSSYEHDSFRIVLSQTT